MEQEHESVCWTLHSPLGAGYASVYLYLCGHLSLPARCLFSFGTFLGSFTLNSIGHTFLVTLNKFRPKHCLVDLAFGQILACLSLRNLLRVSLIIPVPWIQISLSLLRYLFFFFFFKPIPCFLEIELKKLSVLAYLLCGCVQSLVSFQNQVILGK